jgi:hypothetical protein
MAELGQTSDPRELVPGSPEELRTAAQRWHKLAEILDSTGKGLSGLDVGPWQGAAARAFAAAQTEDSLRWSKASEALDKSGAALSRYADTLEWGQRNAVEAARLWQQADGSAAGQQAATELLDRTRQQVRLAGDDTRLSIESARAPADFSAATSPGGTGTKWDDLPGSHPNPSDVHEEWKGRNHTLDGHAPDSREPNKNTFPDKEPWTDDDKLMGNVVDVAKNPDRPPVEQTDPDGGKSWVATGTRDGVTMEVVVEEDGRIRTAYPVAGEGVRHNDENGEPHPLDPREEERRKEAEHDVEQAKQAEQEAEDRAREAEKDADEARRDGDEDAAREAEREREQAEQERQEAEREREVAEQERIDAEQDQEEVEQDQAAEQERREAEQEREEAEQERQDAERGREEEQDRTDEEAQEPAGGGDEPSGGPAEGGNDPADS